MSRSTEFGLYQGGKDEKIEIKALIDEETFDSETTKIYIGGECYDT